MYRSAVLKRGTLLATCIVASSMMIVGCQKKGEERGAPTPEVGVVTLQPQTILLKSLLPGRATSWRVAEVRPQVNGVIKKRFFIEGADVKQGQQLYQIDDAPYKAAYEKARAAVMSTQHLSERNEKLLADNAVSRQQYDDSVSAYRQARADLDTAKVNLDYTKVYAPISGRIGRSFVTEGALVSTGQSQSMAVITQLDPIYVDVTQSSTDLLRLRKELADGRLQTAGKGAASVGLLLEDGTSYAHMGALKFTEVSVDEGTGSVTLRAEFPNPDHQLLPGMFVRTRLDEGVKKDAILVPQQGVTRDTTGEPVAWTVGADGKAQLKQISVDRTIGNTWLVRSGLNAGDRVVTEGVQRLQDGVKVVAVPASNVRVDLGDAGLSTSVEANGS